MFESSIVEETESELDLKSKGLWTTQFEIVGDTIKDWIRWINGRKCWVGRKVEWGGGGNALNSADISNAYDSTCSQQDNLSNKIINNGHSDVNETVFAPQ